MLRRDFIKIAAASLGGTLHLGACATYGERNGSGRVVVVGGGFGGATAARYVKHWAPGVDVTLIEPNRVFVACPFSNRVLGGSLELSALTRTYEVLRSGYGIRVVHDHAKDIDPIRRTVRVGGGETFRYDRLVVAPGVELVYDDLPGLRQAEARASVLHAWKAGAQTLALRKQLESMRDGGVYAICIPKAPYRCPPGPYERACQAAYYFKRHKPRSKVLILDANEDVQSKKRLFVDVWNGLYDGLVEYRPNAELVDVDARTMTAKLQFEDVRADVLNVIPPNRAARFAHDAGLVAGNERWCRVDWRTMEVLGMPGIHVLGDATLSAQAMPKSGHMANQHGKLAADAIVAYFAGRDINRQPVVSNTCYSWVSDAEVVHVASVHAYDAKANALLPVKGAGGLSPRPSRREGELAEGWMASMLVDALG